MRRFFLLSVLFFCLSRLLLAQSYNLFLPEIEYTYSELYGEIKGVRIDSIISAGNDLIYYNFLTPRDTSGEINNYSCVQPKGESWIGSRILMKQGGKALFFGRYGDTIYLKPYASVGETWLFGKLEAGSYIEARIDSIVFSTFIGLADSIKIIHLQAKDNFNNAISHQINNISIKISKNNGMVTLMNFFDYPDCREFSLFGKTGTTAGRTNIANKEVYDFNLGDEFHTDYFRQNVGNGNMQEIKQIKTIYIKTFSANNDTVFYTSTICGVKKETYHLGDYDSIATVPFTDTLIEYHIINKNTNDKLDKMPEETWFSNNQCTYLSLHFNERYQQRLIKYYFGQIFSYNPATNCYNLPPDNHLTIYEYIEGCGGPYYELATCGSVPLFYKLDYYKKGDEEWGEPYYCEDLMSAVKQNYTTNIEVTVSPNPMTDAVSVHIKNYANEKYIFRLYNNLNQLTFETPINSTITRISRNNLHPGIFFYTVTKTNGNIYSGKLIVN